MSTKDETEVLLSVILPGFEGLCVSGSFLITQGEGKVGGATPNSKAESWETIKWYFTCNETQKYQMEVLPCFGDEDTIFPWLLMERVIGT